MGEPAHDKVVALYEEGRKITDITAETGYSRPQIYWILHQRGLRPNRTSLKSQPKSTMELVEALSAAEREVGRLQAENEKLKAQLARARKRP